MEWELKLLTYLSSMTVIWNCVFFNVLLVRSVVISPHPHFNISSLLLMMLMLLLFFRPTKKKNPISVKVVDYFRHFVHSSGSNCNFCCTLFLPFIYLIRLVCFFFFHLKLFPQWETKKKVWRYFWIFKLHLEWRHRMSSSVKWWKFVIFLFFVVQSNWK